MLISNNNIAEQWANSLKLDLVKEYEKQKLIASGKWGKTIEDKTEVSEKKISVQIWAENYSANMLGGRPGNSNQDPKVISGWARWYGKNVFTKWVQDKGLNINPYAVAYKIAREGIKVPNRYNQGTLVSNVLTEERINDLILSLGEGFFEQIKIQTEWR